MSSTNKFKNGDLARDFEAPDLSGHRFQMSLLNRSGVWISFYRYSSCPICNNHFDDVISRRAVLAEYGIQFIAVFESHPENFPPKYINSPFRDIIMVPDIKGALYDVYGVEKSWLGFVSPQPFIERAKAGLKGYTEGKIDGRLDRIPAHFLVLPSGKIFNAYYGRNIADNLKWRDLEPFFEELKKTNKKKDPPNELPNELSMPHLPATASATGLLDDKTIPIIRPKR